MPDVVLFTGGSASNLLARSLEAAGITATHVVSVFDNGGSTGKLRRIADLPAMGDIRNRLCALASSSAPESMRMRALFELRLSKRKSERQLRRELESLVAGDHDATRAFSPTQRQSVVSALERGSEALPEDFRLTEMCLGNLLILGSHLRSGSFLAAIDWARDLLGVGPRVLPVTLSSVHLGAELDDGARLLGQAALTGGSACGNRRISSISLLLDEDSHSRPARDVEACPQVLEAIATADAIVFGFGSFYSSILPHLLVSGVAGAIARRAVPRVLLGNPTGDRETDLMTLADIIEAINVQAGSPLLTHAVHFTRDDGLAIPAGDSAGFVATGGEILAERGAPSFEAIADRATQRVLTLLPAAPSAARRLAKPGYPVVFLDLDHTLFDYASLRRGAAIGALATFCRTPAATCDLLLEHLVPPVTHVLREYGFLDLRQQWNCPAFYAWARTLDDPQLRAGGLRALRQARSAASPVAASSPFEQRRGYLAVATSLESRAGWSAVASAARDLARDENGPFAEPLAAFEAYVATNAKLVPGARRLLEDLAEAGIDVVVVTEGDSSVQRMKIAHLGLTSLTTSAVVADRTLGAARLVEEIFRHSASGTSTSDRLQPAYDELSPYLVKTPAFYGKLVHSLVAAGPGGLAEAVENPVFLTPEQWSAETKPRVATVGDRYNKDLAPLLAACPRGATALRVLQGRYKAQDPLHEILASGKPAPAGHFPSLAAVRDALLGWAAADGPVISRPRLKPDRATLEAFADTADFLSAPASRTLAHLIEELRRHRGEPAEPRNLATPGRATHNRRSDD